MTRWLFICLALVFSGWFVPTAHALTSTSPDRPVIVYNGDGQRVSKTVGGVTTLYLVDLRNPSGYAQVLEELTVSGSTNVTRAYTYGLSLISQRLTGTGGSTNFYGLDGHGSVRFLTSTNGTLTDTYAYDAYGTLITASSATPNHYLYSGEQFDSDLGFYYLRARYLNPDSGRFWTMDTYEGDNEDPFSLHKYLYCQNNPVLQCDPSGKDGELVATFAAIGIVTTIVSVGEAIKNPTKSNIAWAAIGLITLPEAWLGKLAKLGINAIVAKGFVTAGEAAQGEQGLVALLKARQELQYLGKGEKIVRQIVGTATQGVKAVDAICQDSKTLKYILADEKGLLGSGDVERVIQQFESTADALTKLERASSSAAQFGDSVLHCKGIKPNGVWSAIDGFLAKNGEKFVTQFGTSIQIVPK